MLKGKILCSLQLLQEVMLGKQYIVNGIQLVSLLLLQDHLIILLECGICRGKVISWWWRALITTFLYSGTKQVLYQQAFGKTRNSGLLTLDSNYSPLKPNVIRVLKARIYPFWMNTLQQQLDFQPITKEKLPYGI